MTRNFLLYASSNSLETFFGSSRLNFSNFLRCVLGEIFRNLLGSVSTKLNRDIIKFVSANFSRNFHRCVLVNILEIYAICLSQISRNFLGFVSSNFFSQNFLQRAFEKFIGGSRWMFSEFLGYVSVKFASSM